MSFCFFFFEGGKKKRKKQEEEKKSVCEKKNQVEVEEASRSPCRPFFFDVEFFLFFVHRKKRKATKCRPLFRVCSLRAQLKKLHQALVLDVFYRPGIKDERKQRAAYCNFGEEKQGLKKKKNHARQCFSTRNPSRNFFFAFFAQTKKNRKEKKNATTYPKNAASVTMATTSSNGVFGCASASAAGT